MESFSILVIKLQNLRKSKLKVLMKRQSITLNQLLKEIFDEIGVAMVNRCRWSSTNNKLYCDYLDKSGESLLVTIKNF